jgi:hypothetical protein
MLGESFAFATRNESLAYFVCLVKVINAQAVLAHIKESPSIAVMPGAC